MSAPSPLARYGPRLLEQGYPIVPIKRGCKYPRGLRGWEQTEADPDQLDRWLSNGYADGGVGILTRSFPAVDLDVYDRGIVDQLIAWCETHIGASVQRVGEAPKTLLVYRTETPFTKITSATYTDILGQTHKVEVLGDGQQFVAYATHPGTGRPYDWVSDQTLVDVPTCELPLFTDQQARDLVAYFESIVPEDWSVTSPGASGLGASGNVQPLYPEPLQALAYAVPKLKISNTVLRSELSRLDPDMDNKPWVEIGMALHHQFDGGEDGFALWDEWSARGAKYSENKPNELRTRWQSFKTAPNRKPITAATILKRAALARRPDGPPNTPDAPRPTAFTLIHARDVLTKLGPIQWLVTDFLEDNTTGLFFGDPGSFKSFIALDLAFHVAAGKDWHGHAVRQGPVIYIAGEGHGGLARRFAAWERHHGIKLAKLAFYVSTQAARFYDRESADQVVRAVEAITQKTPTPALIVIDTLARNFGGGDENSNTDMGLFLSHVDGLLRARFGATVLIVHHSGHSHKERARGATALKGGMDFEYRIDKFTGLKTRLTCTKMKDAREPEETWFEGQEVTLMSFEDGDMTSLVFAASEPPVVVEKPLKGKQAALYELIENEAPVARETLREIALSDGIFENPDQFKNAVLQLKKKEMIVENDSYINTVDSFFAPETGRRKMSEGGEHTENMAEKSKISGNAAENR